MRYVWHIKRVIRSFRDRDAEALFERRFLKRFSGIERQARRKLEMLQATETLGELRSPPGTRLEALMRDRQGQHSIRINDQCASASCGGRTGPTTSRSSTITEASL